MKTKIIKKEASMVKTLRDIRDRMSLEIMDMSTEELKVYFKKRRELFLAANVVTGAIGKD